MALSRLRGATKQWHLNTNDDEDTDSNGVTAFSATDGYMIGTGAGGYNDNTETFADFHWRLDGTTGEELSDGDITSTVAANQTAGQSAFTATLGAADPHTYSMEHGLGAKPEFWIAKIIDAEGANQVYHMGLTTPEDYVIRLDGSAAEAENTTIWGSEEPTSQYIYMNTGSWGGSVNMYVECYRSIPGFSSFGKYEGNGDADGPFVHLDFAPALVVVINIDADDAGWINAGYTTNRNVQDTYFYWDATDPDASYQTNLSQPMMDIVSNGFILLNTYKLLNSSETFIYCAWAENPFGGHGGTFGGGVAPVTAR